MAKIYLRAILSGNMTIDEVPSLWRDDVRVLLAQQGEGSD